MNYKLSELEDQIIEALQNAPDLSGVTVSTHAGGITGMYFTDSSLKEGLVQQLPFIFVQYQGKQIADSSSDGTTNQHRITFRFFVGAQSLRAKQEAQRDAYSMLSTIYDTLHARFFDYNGTPNWERKLDGVTQIQHAMSQQQGLLETAGQNEGLIVNLPDIVVYFTDYNCKLTA